MPSSGRVIAIWDGHLLARPSTSRRRQIGRPDARQGRAAEPVILLFLKIVFKVLCAWFIIFQSQGTSIHPVIGPAVILSLAMKRFAPGHYMASTSD